MSWEELNKKPEKITDNRLIELQKLAKIIFNTHEGKMFLDHLRDIYSFLPICIPGSPPGSNEIREGEVNFVRKLILMSKLKEG